jgi:hypothetical protein
VSFVRRDQPGYEERRRSVSAGWLCEATLACPSCDAPVAVGQRPLIPADELSCPYCDRQGSARDFLTLGAPSRPARVHLRLGFR